MVMDVPEALALVAGGSEFRGTPDEVWDAAVALAAEVRRQREGGHLRVVEMDTLRSLMEDQRAELDAAHATIARMIAEREALDRELAQWRGR